MTVFYADTSAVIRAYFVDEPDHLVLRKLLFDGADPVVSSELTRVEFASAVAAAGRTGRIERPGQVLARFDLDCGDEGPFTLLRLDPAEVLPLARKLVAELPLRTLDAIHLAVALTDAKALAADDPVVLVTRDQRQAEAARSCGLSVA